MKTFKDLKFKAHPVGNGTIARMMFDNGYGVSVIFGDMFYSNGVDTYELAVVDKNELLIYDTPVTDDVECWKTADEITELMKQVQELC